ncbi:10422_t:CDS:2 [Ambispora gerdemannii]|uniref:10422_t:CDS:1 n=1 Tax=Ambispora gerdemannii TaxID=144530 RepID=A0A9N9FMG4_9GLOM|nr:10422_t:CDS:2 [Ambispora gerdemannii]
MSDYFLSFIGWTFLPRLVTTWLQSLFYKLTYRAGANTPKPGQPKYKKHSTRIYILVVFVYLAYTIIEADLSLQPNYYKILELNHDFSHKDIKTNFRKLQLQYHPDKNPGDEAEATYILIRTAYDTLTDPVKRFGPDINRWDNTKTTRDYLNRGWMSFIEFYLGIGLLLLLLNILGKGQFGRFWRFVAFFGMACIEAKMILYQSPPLFPSLILPHRPIIFEQIVILRQVFITTFIALSQVGPVIFPSDSSPDIRDSLHQLQVLSNIAAEESNNQLRFGFEPFARDQHAQLELKRKMEKLAVDGFLYSDPDYTQMYSQR